MTKYEKQTDLDFIEYRFGVLPKRVEIDPDEDDDQIGTPTVIVNSLSIMMGACVNMKKDDVKTMEQAYAKTMLDIIDSIESVYAITSIHSN